MHEITDIERLEEMKSSGAVLILFGGKQCHVCQVLRPKLENMLQSHYPDMQAAYVDCETSADICAQHGVFSLPVVKVYIEGMQISEFARSFSVDQLRQSIYRSYTMWHESR
ncbi:MAG: thioredoxin family protein [Gammaproteobacteria bacterium]|nr:thioredoxin family protein [Gammaproteobacteria bacterium]